MKKLAIALSVMMAPAAAGAQQRMNVDDYYMGVQMSQFSLDSGSALPTAKPNVLSFTVGQTIHPNVAVEARMGFGVADDTLTYNDEDMPGADVEVELDYAVSLLAKPQAKLNDKVTVYALAGWSRSEITVAGTSAADSGLSVGAGLSLQSSPDLGFYLDWLRLMEEDSVELSSINLGMTYRF